MAAERFFFLMQRSPARNHQLVFFAACYFEDIESALTVPRLFLVYFMPHYICVDNRHVLNEEKL